MKNILFLLYLLAAFILLSACQGNQDKTPKGEAIAYDYPKGIGVLDGWKMRIIVTPEEDINLQLPLYDFSSVIKDYPTQSVTIESENAVLNEYYITNEEKSEHYQKYLLLSELRFQNPSPINMDLTYKLSLSEEDREKTFILHAHSIKGEVISSHLVEGLTIESVNSFSELQSPQTTFEYSTVINNTTDSAVVFEEVKKLQGFHVQDFKQTTIGPGETKEVTFQVKSEFSTNYVYKPALVTKDHRIFPLNSYTMAHVPDAKELSEKIQVVEKIQ